MTRSTMIATLIVAATLEASGDALIRAALHTSTAWHRGMLFAFATLVLFTYGVAVNASPWDFGKLLGLYVVFFFLIAQLIAWVFFNEKLSSAVILGGVFIVVGGFIIAASNLRNHRPIGTKSTHSDNSVHP